MRKIGAIYNDSGKSRAEVVSEFAVQSGYKDESVSADELLTIAQRNRSIVSLYRTEQDEDGEDVTRDDSWNYADILWNGIQAKTVAAAFEQLSYKEQWYLEKRNAICMTCGRVSPLSTQSTFEDLAVDFEGTTTSGAERFYERLGKSEEAHAWLRRALSDAEPDGLVMPFVENYDILKPLLEREIKNDLISKSIELGEAATARNAAGTRPTSFNTLTPREFEIVELMTRRLSNREIAEKLYLSEGSIKQYVNQIYSKLHIEGDTRIKRKQLAELLRQKA